MPKVIYIHGKQNSGKTTTLNKLIISLINEKAKTEKINVIEGKRRRFSSNEEIQAYLESNRYRLKNKKNKEYDYIYYFKHKEKFILVVTSGDDIKVLRNKIKKYINGRPVNVIICAVRDEKTNIVDFERFIKGQNYEKIIDYNKEKYTDEELINNIEDILKNL